MQVNQKLLLAELSKALTALDIAKSVMDYCGGDDWERDCTRDERQRFDTLLSEIRDAAKKYGILANNQTEDKI